MDASGLHCPNCGAAVEPGAGRCPYCRARLATVSCPSCFTLGFEGATYCHKCGAARVRVEKAAATLTCPACRTGLQQVAVGSTPLFECTTCDGVWVDADVFERLCAQKESQAAVLEKLTPREARPSSAAVTYRPCVRCGKMMNRVNFAKVSGAVIDVCRGHGTFLDAGELHQIVAFITSGGIERTRSREREELRDEERRLRDLDRKAARELRDSRSSVYSGSDWTNSGITELINLIKKDPT